MSDLFNTIASSVPVGVEARNCFRLRLRLLLLCSVRSVRRLARSSCVAKRERERTANAGTKKSNEWHNVHTKTRSFPFFSANTQITSQLLLILFGQCKVIISQLIGDARAYLLNICYFPSISGQVIGAKRHFRERIYAEWAIFGESERVVDFLLREIGARGPAAPEAQSLCPPDFGLSHWKSLPEEFI